MHHTPLFHSDKAAAFLLRWGPAFANVFQGPPDSFCVDTHVFSGAHSKREIAECQSNMQKKPYGRAKYRIVVKLKKKEPSN